MESESSKKDKIVVEEYLHGRFVRTREMTLEELDLEHRQQIQKGVETRARHRRIREIVRKNGFVSLRSVLNYILNGGDSTACFRNNFMKDKSTWMQEIRFWREEVSESE